MKITADGSVHAGPNTHNDVHRKCNRHLGFDIPTYSAPYLKDVQREAKVAVRSRIRDADVGAFIGEGDDADRTDILRVFDMTSAYGPCVGMSRLQRWERAKKWGLNPPEEVSAPYAL